MKTTRSLQLLKPLKGIIGLIGYFILSVFFQGCEESNTLPDYNIPYLELRSPLMNSGIQDKKVLKQAVTRLEKYITLKGGKFILDLESGNQVNISNELFEYFENSINHANNLLKDDSYTIIDKRLVKKEYKEIIRLESGIVEDSDGDYYVSYSGIDFIWYGMNINISHDDVVGFQSGANLIYEIIQKI